MKQLFNKAPLFLLIFFLLGFTFISVGGEYLHHHVHAHEHEESKSQDCHYAQLLTQSFIFVSVFAFLFQTKSFVGFSSNVHRFFLNPSFLLPSPRAPPTA